MHVFKHAYIHAIVQTQISQLCMCVHARVCMRVRMHSVHTWHNLDAYTHTHIHTYTHTHILTIYTYTHTHIHTYTHTHNIHIHMLKQSRTHRWQDLKGAPKFNDIQKIVGHVTKDRVIVGHAITNDLECLYLKHPKHLVRDTAKYKPYMRSKRSRKLKDLCKEELGLDIQVCACVYACLCGCLYQCIAFGARHSEA